jgi:hypothetical protein
MTGARQRRHTRQNDPFCRYLEKSPPLFIWVFGHRTQTEVLNGGTGSAGYGAKKRLPPRPLRVATGLP